MDGQTELKTVKAAKKKHRCSWCPERIMPGEAYNRWRSFYQGDAFTMKMHPECYEAMNVMARNEGYDFEFHPGDNPRGCTCGFSQGCGVCEAREAAKAIPASNKEQA